VPEALRRGNGELSASTRAQGWTASQIGFHPDRTSTDQKLRRLIDVGICQGRSFGRFDSRDPSDGSRTSRYCLSDE
jgi:hypothetical protein